MSAEDLLDRPVFKEYNTEEFVDAVDEAYQQWKENSNYKQRVERNDAPNRIETVEEVYEIPVINMEEFKTHADTPLDEHPLVIDADTVDMENALYSSGTTSGTQSMVPRSDEGYRRHKASFQDTTEALLNEDADYMHVIAPSPGQIAQMPEKQRNRAVMKYTDWCFTNFPADTVEHYVGLTEDGEMQPQFSELAENLQEDGAHIVFGMPPYLDGFMDAVEQTDASIDLGEEGIAVTAGGWKGMEGKSKDAFRERMTETLGLQEENHVDFYGFSEAMFPTGNQYGDEDPDKKRVPAQGMVYTVDEETFLTTGEIEPAEEGEPGLAVFVDPLNPDHPGAILSDDVLVKTGGDYGEDVRLEYVERASM